MPPRKDPLDTCTNLQLLERYRFDRNGILFLTQLIGHELEPKTGRSKSLSTTEKILITLRYLATGGIQLNDGDIHEVSQPTVSRAVNQVVNVLSSTDLMSQFINFPTSAQDLKEQSAQFYGVAHFPNIIGVIDGSQIKIKAPTLNEEVYVNRKGFHSINVQFVFDAFDVITNVVARWPGSTHDSRILQNSGLKTLCEDGHLPPGQYHLLGDSGYPCKRWLLTPYINPQPGSQTNYNRAHKKTRSKVERGIGQIKKRFAILHNEIRTEPSKACRIVLACAVLHNICKTRRIQMPDVQVDNDDEESNDNEYQANLNLPVGLRYRDHVANTSF